MTRKEKHIQLSDLLQIVSVFLFAMHAFYSTKTERGIQMHAIFDVVTPALRSYISCSDSPPNDVVSLVLELKQPNVIDPLVGYRVDQYVFYKDESGRVIAVQMGIPFLHQPFLVTEDHPLTWEHGNTFGLNDEYTANPVNDEGKVDITLDRGCP